MSEILISPLQGKMAAQGQISSTNDSHGWKKPQKKLLINSFWNLIENKPELRDLQEQGNKQEYDKGDKLAVAAEHAMNRAIDASAKVKTVAKALNQD